MLAFWGGVTLTSSLFSSEKIFKQKILEHEYTRTRI